MLKRYPDKPHRISQERLEELDNGEYIGTFKKDGWRMILLTTEDGKHQAWSRHNERFDTKPDFAPEIMEAFKALDPPPLTELDTEWERRRAGNRSGVNRCAVISIMRWEKKWLSRTPEEERWAKTLALPVDGQFLYLPEHAESGFREFFEASKKCWKGPDEPGENEGIVLKKKNSTLVLSRRESTKNQSWLKIKWRDGADGCTLTDF
jgi:ATP-dependent DNA ligase